MKIGFMVKSAVAAAFAALVSTAPASAVTVTKFDGQHCGTGAAYNSCTFDDSTAAIMFNVNMRGTTEFSLRRANPLFASLDGSEFKFEVTHRKHGNALAGKWTYTPGEGDPIITAMLLNTPGGGMIASDLNKDGTVGGFWSPGGDKLRVINFFARVTDTGGGSSPDISAAVPLPAGGVLLLSALGAFGILRRRRGA
ncbi:VPLPA-CTERM sorting domain-containing protein [Maritimibacter dapengensis]|uniref:VPLPA-CTERM sorting domain-containing protein n=1 Tax=Maritimibacter dapengensis TaxID=2836868 RepID=A0ABS6T3K4_9RHOB|nr:VPLPA-CTERM sorting domain-containing protein [Maritimibacter dapengensis]MBV7379808.1 VPLPA-CTERM sorting domain-containing protein [Maritimibacter dapengensis]